MRKTVSMRKKLLAVIPLVLLLLALSGCEWFDEMGRDNPWDPDSAWIGALTPADGAVGVAIASAVTVTFLRDLAETSVTETTFLVNAGETAVTGALAYTAETKTVTFTPAASLAYSTTYTVTIPTAGITDAAGNAFLKEYAWSFTTIEEPEVPPPKDPEPSGSLDLTFRDATAGTSGYVWPLKYTANNEYTTSVVIDNEGRIVVAGYDSTSGNSYLIRYLEGGTMDTSFDGVSLNNLYLRNLPANGYLSFYRENVTYIRDIVVLSDGSMIAAGEAGSYLRIAKFGDDGGIDRGFDGGPAAFMHEETANGFFQFYPYDEGSQWTSSPYIAEILPLSGGGFYTVGYGYTTLINGSYNYDGMIMKFNADGSLDDTFGVGAQPADGCVTWNYGDFTLQTEAATLDSSGRIVACGHNADNGHGIVARFNADGTLDTASFNAPVGYIDSAWAYSVSFRSLAIDSEGRIVVVGENYSGGYTNLVVVRYQGDGNLDATFDGGDTAGYYLSYPGDGKVELDPLGTGTSTIYPIDIIVDDQDRIVIGGGMNGDFMLLRLTETGVLDASFDGLEDQTINYPGNGYLRFSLSDSDDTFTSLAIDSEGRIVAAGNTLYNSTSEPAVFRIWP